MEAILFITFLILTIGLWFWAIFDLTRSRFHIPTMKPVWLLVVLFFPVIGSIFYFQFRKKLIDKEPRKFQPDFNRADFKND